MSSRGTQKTGKRPAPAVSPTRLPERRFDRPRIPEPHLHSEPAPSAHSLSRLTAVPTTAEAPEPIQGRFTPAEPSPDRILHPPGSGNPLPEAFRQQMESAFDSDFSDVRTHVGSEAPSIGAIAYTRGSNIHFAPGQLNPSSPDGQKLLAHELTHVVQQRAGRVPVPPGGGLPINDDPALEREADANAGRALRQPES